QPARRHVAIHLPLRPDEDDAVPGGIACVPFHLLVGHRDARAVQNYALAVGDDRDIAVALGFEVVGLEGVRLAATGDAWMVRLLERLKPSTHIFGLVRPLSIIAGLCRHEADRHYDRSQNYDQKRRTSAAYRDELAPYHV